MSRLKSEFFAKPAVSTEDTDYTDGSLEIHYNDADDEHQIAKVANQSPTDMVNDLVAQINDIRQDKEVQILFISQGDPDAADAEEDDDDDDDDEDDDD